MSEETLVPKTKVARHATITKILSNEKITSQIELQESLSLCGIDVTQATLSRDLFELGVTKVRDEEGKPLYALTTVGANVVVNGPENAGLSRLTKWCQELLVTATCNNNFVVLRTPAGAAQLMASALDNSILPEVLGSVAGDDTVMVMCTDTESANKLTGQLLMLANGMGQEAAE